MINVPVRCWKHTGTTWSETVRNGNDRQRRSGGINYEFSQFWQTEVHRMRRRFEANTNENGSVPDCVWKRWNGNGSRIDAGTKNKENGTNPSKQEIRYAIDNGIGTN